MLKPKKGSWIVRIRQTVKKDLVCNNCTEEEARNDPFQYSDQNEQEIDSEDWEVLRVEEGK